MNCNISSRPAQPKAESAKGQLISKCLFGVFNFSQKTNENKSTWGIIVVKLNIFIRFLGELRIPKSPFEINWPLGWIGHWAAITKIGISCSAFRSKCNTNHRWNLASLFFSPRAWKKGVFFSNFQFRQTKETGNQIFSISFY